MSMTKEAKTDAVEPEARRLRREFFDDEMLDKLMSASDERGVSLTGEGGFLPEMIKAVLGVDEHVVRHEALLFRMEVRDLHRLAVAAAG